MEQKKSRMTTLCYLEKDGCYLMLHRIKKKEDINQDKWIGVGGHFEEGESPEECLVREVREETGLRLLDWEFRGIITFCADTQPAEYMCLYTSRNFEGGTEHFRECKEGVLEWVKKEKIQELNLWEGDKIFLKLLAENAPFFSLKLCYEGNLLKETELNGKKLDKKSKIY